MATKCYNYDNREDIRPVSRNVVVVTIADTASSGSTVVDIYGRIITVIADVPDLTGVGTLAIDIQDEDGTNLFAQKAAIAENTKTRWDLQAAATPHGCVCAGGVKFLCTASAGAQTGAKTINLIVYYI